MRARSHIRIAKIDQAVKLWHGNNACHGARVTGTQTELALVRDSFVARILNCVSTVQMFLLLLDNNLLRV